MKKIASFLFLFSLLLGVKSQNSILSKHLGNSDLSLIGHPINYAFTAFEAGDNFLFVYSAERIPKKAANATIYKINKDMTSCKFATIKFPQAFHFIGCTDNNESISAFYHFLDKKADKLIIKKVSIDKSNIQGKNTIENIASFEVENKDNSYFLTSSSPDKSKYAVTLMLTDRKNSFKGFYISVFDNSGSQLWENIATPHFDNDFFDLSAIEVNNDGTVYLGISSRPKKSSKNNTDNKFHLFMINETEHELYTESFPDGYIKNMKLLLLKNGKLFIGGYYSENLNDNATGSFSYLFDPSISAFENKNHQIFSSDYKGKFVPFGIGNKFAYQQYGISCDYIFELDNGNIVMLGEQIAIKEANTQLGKSYVLYARNILVNTFKVDGDFDRFKLIKKHQASGSASYIREPNDVFLSYNAFAKENKVYMIYNDNAENLISGSDQEELFNLGHPIIIIGKKSCVTLAILDEEYSVDKVKVMDCASLKRVYNKFLFSDGKDAFYCTYSKKMNSVSKFEIPN